MYMNVKMHIITGAHEEVREDMEYLPLSLSASLV